MQRGASLLEIAIAAGVMGLFLGMVLTVVNMTQAAASRNTANLIQSYDSAVGTFRLKYVELPGDARPETARSYNFAERVGGAGHGDGNGMVEGCERGIAASLGCENALFWRDLSQVGLIGGVPFHRATDAAVDGTTAIYLTSDYLPISPFRGLGHIFMTAPGGQNHYYLGRFATVGKDGAVTTDGAITPKEARDLDDKIDDGKPASGRMRSMAGIARYDVPLGTPEATGCMDQDRAYDTSVNTLRCQVIIRSGF